MAMYSMDAMYGAAKCKHAVHLWHVAVFAFVVAILMIRCPQPFNRVVQQHHKLDRPIAVCCVQQQRHVRVIIISQTRFCRPLQCSR